MKSFTPASICLFVRTGSFYLMAHIRTLGSKMGSSASSIPSSHHLCVSISFFHPPVNFFRPNLCGSLIEGKQCFSTKLKYLLKVSAFTVSVTGSCKKARIILAMEAIWQFIVCVSAALIRARFDQTEFKFCSLLYQSMEV